MLHILWMLLKIIGIILAVILGILVLTICIVFFVPLRYTGKANASGSVESIKAQAKFSWLFHLFSGWFQYENGEAAWQMRVLWKKWSSSDERSEEGAEAAKSVSERKSAGERKSADAIPVEENGEASEGKQSGTTKGTGDNKGTKKETQSTKTKKMNFLEKIKYTIGNFCDMIKSFKDKKDKLQEFITDEIHLSSWKRLTQEIFRLLRCIKPRKLEANLHFGLEDPAATGKVLAALSMLYPFYGEHIRITPDFEEKILEGDVFVKGRIRSVHAFIMAWNLFFDKNIRATYNEIQKWK